MSDYGYIMVLCEAIEDRKEEFFKACDDVLMKENRVRFDRIVGDEKTYQEVVGIFKSVNNLEWRDVLMGIYELRDMIQYEDSFAIVVKIGEESPLAKFSFYEAFSFLEDDFEERHMNLCWDDEQVSRFEKIVSGLVV